MTDRSNQVQLVTFCHKPGHIAGSGIKMGRQYLFSKSMRLMAFSPMIQTVSCNRVLKPKMEENF